MESQEILEQLEKRELQGNVEIMGILGKLDMKAVRVMLVLQGTQEML